jgi:hypothetical protein
MKQILAILLATIFLSGFTGCSSSDYKPAPFEQFQYDVELKKVETNDNQELYAVSCYKRKYRVWTDKIAALENFQLVSANECKFLIGYQPKASAELWALMDYVRKEINAQEQQVRIFREIDQSVVPGTNER